MNDERAEQVLLKELPLLPPGAAGDPFNFVNEVLHFLTRWCTAYASSIPLGQPAYCCFIGSERVASEAQSHSDLEQRPLFREDTPQNLLGHIFLCSFPFNNVFGRSANFANFADCEKAILALGGTEHPTIVFNAADRRVLWRVPGSSSLHQVIIRTTPAPLLLSAEFDKALDDFHYEYTVTPDGLSASWDNATDLLTKPQLERETACPEIRRKYLRVATLQPGA